MLFSFAVLGERGKSPACTSENAVVRKDSMRRSITVTEQLRGKTAFLVNQAVLMAQQSYFGERGKGKALTAQVRMQ